MSSDGVVKEKDYAGEGQNNLMDYSRSLFVVIRQFYGYHGNEIHEIANTWASARLVAYQEGLSSTELLI
jgi:hypothetical protein